MKKVRCRFLFVLTYFTIIFAAAFFLGTTGCYTDPDPVDPGVRPIVFVHGYAGSGDQFELQALRFASNGYPDNYFTGFEHDTVGDDPEKIERLDATIDAVLSATGADKVDLAGHSMGTGVSSDYLDDPARAAKVAHYINIDGMPLISLPDELPVLNLKAVEPLDISGAINIELDQTHVQAASSVESFVHMYKFLHDNAEPATMDVLPALTGTIRLKGRLITFLTNIVPADSIVTFYEVNPNTGKRLNSMPDYKKAIGDDGNFDFTNAKQGASYEIHLTMSDNVNEGHYYYEPFVRTDTLIRLKYTEPGSDLDTLLVRDNNSSTLLITRNKEMQGEENNVRINGTEIVEGIMSTSSGLLGLLGGGPIGLFVMDVDSDQVSHLDEVSDVLSDTPFVEAIDFFLPASSSASGTINIEVKGSGSSTIQTINVPNWESTQHKILTQFLAL